MDMQERALKMEGTVAPGQEIFSKLMEGVEPEEIDNFFFRKVAVKHGVNLVADLIMLFEEVYPNSKTGQRKIPVPLKSTLCAKSQARMINGLA